MPSTITCRSLAGLLVAVVALTLSAAAPGLALSNAAASMPAGTVLSGMDYASTTFGDPWDYSNASDLVLDKGPALGLANTSISGGQLHFTTHNGYVSPLWGSYANVVAVEREGTRAGNAIDATTYARMHLRVNVSAVTNVALSWYTCGALRAACNGAMNFTLQPGWNDIDRPIVRSAATGKAWAGRMVGLRLAFGVPGGRAAVHLDSLRIYRPSNTSAITWAAPGASSAALWWTDRPGVITASEGANAGPVAGAPRSANSSAVVSTNVSGYAPGTSFWSLAADGTKTLVGATAPAPLPVIDSPSAAGCEDYATRYLHRPWTFPSKARVASIANAGALSFSAAGVLSATNAGPQRNDPSVILPIAPGGINGRLYHRLTIVESYDGPFNLENRPGGGAMARVLWQSVGHTMWSQTAPLVTFTGKRSLTVDMAMAPGQLTDPSGPPSQRYAFASPAPVTKLRYDPNEDPGARRWHLFSVRLTADCSGAASSAVTWHDGAFVAGSTVRLTARNSAGRFFPLGSAVERAGANKAVVSMRALPRGKYVVVIYVTNPAGVRTSAVSSGPLLKV